MQANGGGNSTPGNSSSNNTQEATTPSRHISSKDIMEALLEMKYTLKHLVEATEKLASTSYPSNVNSNYVVSYCDDLS